MLKTPSWIRSSVPSTVISVENLSKSFRLGVIGTGTFYGDLNRWWARRRGKPDPYHRVGETGHRQRSGETIFALKDVTFSVQHGKAVGIIGRNGAGKSTLLKILSRVTAPTSGVVKVKGGIASLLEVGTGFHPELTGRENIFMNGAILGMNRSEVTRKFDEIVDFSGVEQFIDTPVKRYSSGMYVRLAFAVAAHLEPEILVVDEVLAVGDAQFQKKCLGKMSEVVEEGRTVLFVSHNMGIIRSLCSQTILLVDGQIARYAQTNDVINHYLSAASQVVSGGEISWDLENAPGSDELRLCRIRLLGNQGKLQNTFDVEQPIKVEITYRLLKPLGGYRFILHLINQEGITVLASTDHRQRGADMFSPGYYHVQCEIPPRLLNHGAYRIIISSGIPNVKQLVRGEEYLTFTVEEGGTHGSFFPENWPGVVAPELKWTRDEQIEK
jgi:lipopolysaccharide transport system ATP-binding protein